MNDFFQDPFIRHSSFVDIVKTVTSTTDSLTASPPGFHWWMESFIGFQGISTIFKLLWMAAKARTDE
jgi:hypothetical protein